MYPILLSAALLAAPNSGPVVTWKFKLVSVDQGLMAVELTANMSEGWHIYATTLANNDGPVPTSIRFAPSDSYQLISPLVEPTPEEVYDANFSMQVRYHSHTARFVQRVRPKGTDPFALKGEVEYMACNDKTCLPPETVSFVLDVPDRDLKP